MKTVGASPTAPKGPCTQLVYSLAPKYISRDYFGGRSMYYLGTWQYMELGFHECLARIPIRLFALLGPMVSCSSQSLQIPSIKKVYLKIQ